MKQLISYTTACTILGVTNSDYYEKKGKESENYVTEAEGLVIQNQRAQPSPRKQHRRKRGVETSQETSKQDVTQRAHLH